MTSEAGYKFDGSLGKGTIVVATKDFLCGEVVMEEKEAILKFDNKFLDTYVTAHIPREKFTCFAAYSVFCNLPSEKKQQLLSLYGPTNCTFAQNMRKFASCGGFLYKNRILPSEEIETFVKVCSVSRLNMFGDDNNHYIFGDVTRMAHSCQSNCHYSLRSGKCCVRANRHINAGEELTITYVGERDVEPTHERRYQYLINKDFTCHCPRCDAPGDDTRQFDCVDPGCDGVMMVCQPINNKPIPLNICAYTGVEYVEPHLLPCTVCHRAAPADYQQKMFTLEAQLPALAARFAAIQRTLVGKDDANEYQPLLAEIDSLHLPRRHLLCLAVHDTVMKVHRYSFLRATHYPEDRRISHFAAEVRRAAADYVAAIEGVLPCPHHCAYDILYAVVSDCILEWRQLQELRQKQPPIMLLPPIFPPFEAKALLQKTLRMHLVLGPRETRSSALDTALLHELTQLAQAGGAASDDTTVCAFCEESPLRAALTLSRCGRCKQVAYCSVGCQKAHWKLHKKKCQVVTT